MTEAAPNVSDTDKEQALDLVRRAESGDARAIAEIDQRERANAANTENERIAVIRGEEEAAFDSAVSNTGVGEFVTGLVLAKNPEPAACTRRATAMVALIELVGGDVIQVSYGATNMTHTILIQYTAPPSSIPALQRRLDKAAQIQ